MSEYNRDTLGFITRCRNYGDVVRMRFLYLTAYFIYHPNDIEYILSTNAENFVKSRSLRSPFFHALVGQGLLTSEGELWRRQRRLAQPTFHRKRIESYGMVMVEYAQRATVDWKEGEIRDIHRDMMRLTLEIVVKLLFSSDISRDADRVGDILSEMTTPFASQATLKWILDNRLPTRASRRYHQNVAKIDQIIYRIIGDRRARKSDEVDLLAMLLAAADEDGSRMTDRQLRDEVVTLFLAGHETTALTLSWAWYLLAKHPKVAAKFHDELEAVLAGKMATAADLPRLKYVEMIAKESMRLFPPAYAVGREAIKECEIGGFRVPAGTQLFMFQWATQRDPRFFEDPDRFYPERWDEVNASNLPKYAYFPFGGGPRVCIGNYFAMMEIILILATIGQRYRFSLAPNQSLSLLPAMSLRPRDGIEIVVHEK